MTEQTHAYAPELREWARHKLADELVLAREASTASRRAWHEGIAAALCFPAGDQRRGENIVTTILADYSGVRATQGRAGYATAVAMIRGVADYIGARGEQVADEWTRDAAVGTDA